MEDSLSFSIIIAISTGLTASILFLLLLSRLRPTIIVSKQIAKTRTPSGEDEYIIKILNKTYFSIINVKAQLHWMLKVPVPEGHVEISTEVPLKQGETVEIGPLNLNDHDARYAFRFTTSEDLETHWDGQKYLRFKIYAVHSLSGFGKVFPQYYYTKGSDLVSGIFVFGNSLEIK